MYDSFKKVSDLKRRYEEELKLFTKDRGVINKLQNRVKKPILLELYQ